MNTLKNKKELVYKQGRLFVGNELVSVSRFVVSEANRLERMLQKAEVIKANKQTVETSMVKPIEFKFVSEHESDICLPKPKTPHLDKRVKEHEALAEEDKKVRDYNVLQVITKDFKHLIEFVNNDEVIVGNEDTYRFDLKTIGNPLKLNKDKLVECFTKLIPVWADLNERKVYDDMSPLCLHGFGLPPISSGELIQE